MRSGACQRKVTGPRQSVDRVRCRAGGGGEARHLGKTPRDQRRLRVVPEAKAGRAARRDGDDVFHCTANGDPKRVVPCIDTKVAVRKGHLHGCDGGLVVTGGGNGRRQPL